MTTKRKNKISGWFRKIPLNIGTFIFGALFVYMVITVILYLTADHIQSSGQPEAYSRDQRHDDPADNQCLADL